MVENKIKNTIIDKKLIAKGGHIVVGLSGGPDSVCLFDVLLHLSEELQFTVSAVHVNHKFRPGAAEEDQAYVEDLCEKRGIPCYSFVYDCNGVAEEKGLSSEEAGRLVRYQSFYAVAKKMIDSGVYEPSQIKIAVAQNLNDQAETLLMRIIRGTGTDGLAGIEYSRPGEYRTTVIRPLLDVSRKEIEEYCREQNLAPRIDHTNSQPIYTRNKIRLNLIPELERTYNTNLVESLNRLSRIAKEDKNYFDGQVDEAMDQAAVFNNGISFGLDELRQMHCAIRHRVIRKAFETIGLTQGITSAHIEATDKIVVGGSDSASTDFPKGYSAAVSYGEVRFFKNDPVKLGYVSQSELKNRLVIRIVKEKSYFVDFSKNGSKRFAALDLEKVLMKTPSIDFAQDSETLEKHIEESIQIRTRCQGDWMVPLGMTGRKKIQDMFIDEKVYKECRDKVPMVCIGDEVLWIIGDDVSRLNTGMKRGRISENFKLDTSGQDIVLLEFLE